MAGYWTKQAGQLAKKVKNNCMFCQYLDYHPIHQQMGTFSKERFVNPVAWGDIKLDLMEPYMCRYDVSKRSTVKVWGVVLEDINSGAVYFDIVLDYSAVAVITMLKQFS